MDFSCPKERLEGRRCRCPDLSSHESSDVGIPEPCNGSLPSSRRASTVFRSAEPGRCRITTKLVRQTIDDLNGILDHAPLATRVAWVRGPVRADRRQQSRRTATSEIVLPHPVRSREWLKLAHLECQRCHRFVERRSPIQRHCPDCTRMLSNERSRRAVARRRHEHPG
jgi:hypothetical protein